MELDLCHAQCCKGVALEEIDGCIVARLTFFGHPQHASTMQNPALPALLVFCPQRERLAAISV